MMKVDANFFLTLCLCFPLPPETVLSTCPFIVSHLIPALIRLYVEIEHTGSDSQFYTKFNVRHAIAVMIRWCAQFKPYVAVLEKEARSEHDTLTGTSRMHAHMRRYSSTPCIV